MILPHVKEQDHLIMQDKMCHSKPPGEKEKAAYNQESPRVFEGISTGG